MALIWEVPYANLAGCNPLPKNPQVSTLKVLYAVLNLSLNFCSAVNLPS